MACPRKLFLRAAMPQNDRESENTFVPSPLHLVSNSAKIKNIICNSGVAVPLRLLAIEELIKILYHTISWLKIENERPHFYIYYYGKQPVVETNLNEARNNITRSLRTRLKNYEKGEYFCNTSRVRTDAANFTIYDSNPYQFTVS